MSITLSLKSWLGVTETPEELMLKYSETGNRQCLSRLIDALGDDLYFYLLRQSNPELAQDISQQTWLKVIDKRNYYRSNGSVKSWLFKIARCSLIDEYRKLNRWQSISDEMLPVAQDSALAELVKTDQLAAFNQALSSLPFLQREALVLQQEGLSLREIAAVTDSEIETIKTRLRYAKQQLKVVLSVEDHNHE